MSLSLTLACLWAVVANVLAMTPSKDQHWRNAYILIALGLPIVGYVAVQHGPWVALLVLVGACSVLRWPVIYLGRWLRRVVLRRDGAAE
ncbi:DUF2484 family protein [Sulfitobacter mediterraneus]|uniref:DUF2484 family protein n=1 Tax=Sulfitobacter mediterraneus TaxID=83219 RepID=UPI00193ACA2A|nr:DUF2484 family protein [Sulfitobacter mediterraneus]MBM1557370.1 DUF2484 family protein [Sulfitobacter mediterraneus]MBM1568416.1 DUF2484 family protein [Sulfitobacter mediterraneus]MBM1571981.1 DUF2484 family protein [Sulfitobacter mediterraneus]MBM1575770.1 DUF2484 family protein [Sulfitobacter mediterraneus]MBM1580092.1 DUF2484 family protein [Sulfitobacter mediterraneus]